MALATASRDRATRHLATIYLSGMHFGQEMALLAAGTQAAGIGIAPASAVVRDWKDDQSLAQYQAPCPWFMCTFTDRHFAHVFSRTESGAPNEFWA